MATSTIRRKPIHTYKSPSFDTTSDQLSYPIPRATPRASSSASHSDKSTTEGTTVTVIVPYVSTHATKHRQPPALPLYHPLGPFALSLPKLDPGFFGLPNQINVDDAVDEPADPGRRSSSRARRPAAKVRERDGADEEDAAAVPTTSAQSAPREAGTRAPGSPRKRRAGGGAGGARRKRKAETEEVDGAFPPPAKRTRNPRGTGNATPVVASPLVSEAVVASVEEVPEAEALPSPEGAEMEEVATELPAAPEPKRTRTRKARAPATKRRNSSASASTNTSVSVSIAANTRTTRAKAARESASDGDGEKKEEEEGEAEETPRGQVEEEERAMPPSPVENLANTLADDKPKAEEQKDEEKMEVDAPPVAQEPLPALAPIARLPSPPPEKEEKEEGELSDEH